MIRRALVRSTLLLLALLSLPATVHAADLKIATWNLDWLTTRAPGDPALPADVKPRRPEDFDLLRRYAMELDADVVAIEEVDGRDAAQRVFPAEHYSIHMSRDRVIQRVGIVVRRGLRYDLNPDVVLSSETGSRLRSGVDITLKLAAGPLRLLAVHLKRGCEGKPLKRASGGPCQTLWEQMIPLRDWIAARHREGIAFVILGDFNRTMDKRDPFLAALRQAAPLVRATEGHSSPCWGSEAFIDHILAGEAAARWMRPDSLRVMTYRETAAEWRDRLSDHCPVSVRLAVPD